MGGDSARRAGRAQEQQPRARGRDKQCAGPCGWTAQCKEKWGERLESWASPRGTSAKGLGKCVPRGRRILAKMCPRSNSAFCFPSVKLAAAPALSSLRCVGRWHSTCWACFRSQDGGLLPSHSAAGGRSL